MTPAELDDPAGFAGIVLPGLATLVGCNLLTYNEIGPDRGQSRYADFPEGALDPATQPAFEAHVHEHPLVGLVDATSPTVEMSSRRTSIGPTLQRHPPQSAEQSSEQQSLPPSADATGP